MSKCFICKGRSYLLVKFKGKKEKKVEFNLCKNCLEKYNLFLNTGNKRRNNICPVCGYTLKDFKEYRFLGCDFCYEYFFKEVSDYLKKIHINTIYKGKYPVSFKADEKIKKIYFLKGFLIDEIVIDGRHK
jgi:protein-arginine kinase activator protein McsA